MVHSIYVIVYIGFKGKETTPLHTFFAKHPVEIRGVLYRRIYHYSTILKNVFLIYFEEYYLDKKNNNKIQV